MTDPTLPSIDGYRILRVIGHGGMSTVYLAEQTSLERKVALKVMLAEVLGDEVSRARFENEARIIARLEHPNIVGIFEVGRTTDGLPFYSMPYLSHGHLAQRKLAGNQPKVAAILRSLLQALDYAHVRGVVHRDVKAENVLFDDTDRPMLADFGIALRRGNNPRLTNAGLAVGSTAYMPPEQARGQEVDRRADLYSIGVLAWEMLMGRLPYNAGDALSMAIKHVQEPIPRLPAVLRHWQPFIDKAMDKRADQRFTSANEMLGALDALEAQAGKFFVAVEIPADAGNGSGKSGWGLSKKQTLITTAIAGAILAALSLPLLVFNKPADKATESTPPLVAQQPTPPPAATHQPSTEDDWDSHDSDQSLGIAAYLANAKQQLDRGQLLPPGNANAWNSLKAAWQSNPTHPQTLQLTAQLFDALANASVDALRKGDVTAAINAFEHARQLDARRGGTGAAIAALRKRLDAALEARLDVLLARPSTRTAAAALVRDIRWIGLPEERQRALQARAGASTKAVATSEPNAAPPPPPPPVHLTITRVTRSEYARFANATGRVAAECGKGFLGRTLKWSNTGGDSRPVVCVSAADAQAYATWASAKDGERYRLPSAGEIRSHAPSAGTGWLNLCADHNCQQRTVNGKSQPLDASRGYDDVGILLVHEAPQE